MKTPSKRLLSLLLILAMLLSLAPTPALALDTEEIHIREEASPEDWIELAEEEAAEDWIELTEETPEEELIVLVDEKPAAERSESAVAWELGTITAAAGKNSASDSRLRTALRLPLDEYGAVTLNEGWQLTWLAYDGTGAYLGNGSADLTANWLPGGLGVSADTIRAAFPNARSFRLALRAADSRTLTLDDVSASGVRFYAAGEEHPEIPLSLSGSSQDGAYADGKLFVLNSSGRCTVYEAASATVRGSFQLDRADQLLPHANAVCFSGSYYSESDKYPLLYVNVYNSYANAEDRMPGTLCVYRITEGEEGFASELVQVLRIGFTDSAALWSVGGVRPYGNFLIDTDANRLYAYVMCDADNTTRFLCFALPAVDEGEYSEALGCPVRTLTEAEIEQRFDTEYFRYIQGGACVNGYLLSLEGFDTAANPALLRVVSLATGEVVNTLAIADLGWTGEPELLAAAPDGTVFYAAKGRLHRLRLVDLIPKAETGEEENLWEGRSAVFVGDSITAGTGTTTIYYQYLNETLALGSVTALGIGGSCISAASNYGHANQPLIDRYQSIPSADLIVVFMGTNDYGHETPLGLADDAEDGSFYEALNTVVPALVAAHPSSRIVFVTPLHRYGFGSSAILGMPFTSDDVPNGVGATLGDYAEAIRAVCARYDVPVIDLYAEYTPDPSDPDVRSAYMPDGLHPNAVGHEQIAGIMEACLRRYVPAEGAPPDETELVYGNRFASGYTQQNRASSRVNYYLKEGTVITLKEPAVYQWACARTSGENSSDNLGYFPDSGWSDQTSAAVNSDGWVGFVFKYRDETKTFDLTKPLSDYITIETPQIPPETLTLRYDDHLDLSGKTVEIVDAGAPTSYQVGYGIEANTPDEAVVRLEGETLIASGVGTALVSIDGAATEITVEAAPISLLLLIGQSNMRGSEGNPDQSIVCPDGVVYATYGDDRGADNTALTAANGHLFAPSALAGPGSLVNSEGTTDCIGGYPINTLNEAGAGKMGPDSGIAYEWARATGEKVWVVNAAHGGSSITTWQPSGANYKEAVALFGACEETLRQEIAAGHYTLSHMGYFWCQGCNDAGQTAAWYETRFLTMHESLKSALAFDHDSDPATPAVTLEFADILLAMAGSNGTAGYRRGSYENESGVFFSTYKEMELRGHRVAQLALAASAAYPDIHMVCTLGETWLSMPDGTNGVRAYFEAQYPNGRVDYTVQAPQNESWYTPTKPTDVKDSIHYNQIGYNEVGIECARNACILLGYLPDTDEPTELCFVDWTGFETVSSRKAMTAAQSATLVVPLVTPCYRSKSVTYTLSEGLSWNSYDLLAARYDVSGTLTGTVGGAETSVAVNARSLTEYAWALEDGTLVSVGEEENALTRLSGTTEDGLFLNTRYQLETPVQLLHDEEWSLAWTMSGPWYGEDSTKLKKIFSEEGNGSAPGAMSVMIGGGGQRIYLGYYDGSTHQQFGFAMADFGIDIAQEHSYRLVNRITDSGNRIYLFVDGEELGSMTHWYTGSGGDQGTESDALSGRDFSFGYLGPSQYPLHLGIISSIRVVEHDGLGELHFHSWGEWEHLTVPTRETPGTDRCFCTVCGKEKTRENPGVWTTLSLNAHQRELPEPVYCDTNLWALLEHDAKYFNGTAWTTHPSGSVYSLTFALEPGERIFASSFGKAGENGHATSNGIRMTFFDAYGVARTMTPNETYAAFTANGGYLEAPAGTVAVNIPLWTNEDSNEVYILSRPERPANANYRGKVVSILGDSISTFAGYIPVADGFNLEHLARYPQDNLLTDVNETWWMQLINDCGAKLGVNDSWRGATVSGAKPVTSGTTGENAAMCNLTRIQNLGSNGTPDLIVFYGGTNDYAHVDKLGSFDAATAPTEVDLTTKSWDNLADAYVQTLLRLQYYYPEAQLVCILPGPTATYYSNDKLNSGNELLLTICAHYGVPAVDLRESGLTVGMLPDGIHPDAEGMDKITEALSRTVLAECTMTPGENTVYEVSHTLTGAAASLGHWKGVSAGKPFVETISGDNLSVHVTMDGEDVTEEYWQDGLLSIPAVTGPLSISAVGQFSLGAHLRELPEELCCGVNLWTALSHDAEYYSVDGWTVHGSGKVYSVTFPMNPGERVWASSFAPAGENGGTSNGIRVTFFGAEGVIVSMSSGSVCEEFQANGFLTAPEGTTAVCVPMWTNSAAWELYLLDREHDWGAWEQTTAPTATEPGEEARVCAVCGAEEKREVPAQSSDPMLADGTLSVLFLGNSFGWDAADIGYGLTHSQMYEAMQCLLLEDIELEIGVLYRGSSTLGYHATSAKKGSATYTYSAIGDSTGGEWDMSAGSYNKSIQYALDLRDWDIVVIQSYQHEADNTAPRSTYTGGDAEFDSPADSIPWLLDYFAENEPGALIYYFMPWASTKFYGSDGVEAGFAAIAAYTPEVLTYAGTQSGKQIAKLVPVGAGIQNARTTYLDALRYNVGGSAASLTDDAQVGLLRDRQHLSFEIGRYLAGNVLAEAIIPQSMRNESYVLPAMKDSAAIGALPAQYTEIAQAAVAAAVASPYEITVLTGWETDPTFSAAETAAAMNLSFDGCTDEDTLKADISAAVLAALPADFAVEEISFPEGFCVTEANGQSVEATVRLRFGYTSRDAALTVTLLDQGHDYVSAVTPPTYGREGYTSHVCTRCGHSYTDAVTEPLDYAALISDGTFKVLFIGNSFSTDAGTTGQTQLLDILQALLGEDVTVTVGVCYSGGKTMTWHATQAERNEQSYTMTVIQSGGRWRSVGTVSSAEALSYTDWDAVSLQPYDAESVDGQGKARYPDGEDEKFYPLAVSTAYMLDHVATYAPGAAVYDFMPWVRTSVISHDSGLDEHNRMAAFTPTVLSYAGTESGLRYSDVAPVGAAIQTAKTSYLGLLDFNRDAETVSMTSDPQDGLLRDGWHVSFQVGRYITALVYAETMIPQQIRSESYTLPGIAPSAAIGPLPADYTRLAQLAAGNALQNWRDNGALTVIAIEGWETDPAVLAQTLLDGAAIALDVCEEAELSAALGTALDERLAGLRETWPELAVDEIAFVPDGAGGFSAEVTLRFGYTTKIAAVSGSYALLGHDWDEGVVILTPTGTEEGTMLYTCRRDPSHTRTEAIPAAGSAWYVMEQNDTGYTLSFRGAGAVTDPLWLKELHAAEINTVYVPAEITALPGDLLEKLPGVTTVIAPPNSDVARDALARGLTLRYSVLRVLLIGNSHTNNYSAFLANIKRDLAADGMTTDIRFTKSVIGSIGLYSGRNSNVNATDRSQLEALEHSAGAYSYLKNNCYDLIIVQDYMESTVDEPAVFAEGLASFLRAVRQIVEENGRGEPEIAWFADWVDIRSCGGDNSLYDGQGNRINLPKRSREEVYAISLANIAQIEACIAAAAADMPDFVIRASTVKQNAMSSYFGTSTQRENSKCLLEADNTHLSAELGCYLMGVCVSAELLRHYENSLLLGEHGAELGAVLSLDNRPQLSGSSSQYTGQFNESILAVIREAIGSPEAFRPSVYVTDPLDALASELEAAVWDLSGCEDAAAAQAAIEAQLAASYGERLDSITAEVTDFAAPGCGSFTLSLSYGYSFRTQSVTLHTPGEAVEENRVEATCTVDGGYDTVVYCTCCGGELSRVHTVLPATGHEWGEPTYTWAGDNSTVTAKRVCLNDASHIETETVNTSSAVTKPATCEEPGETTYTASFTDPAFATQTKTLANIPATGHAWGEPTYTWAEDNSKVTAKRVCGNDASHVETETVNTASAVTKSASCEEPGETTYTATFANPAFATQTKTLANIPATGHDWGEPAWLWTGYTTATATFTCLNDAAHVETVNAAITSVRTEPTPENDGSVVYTATVSFNGQTWQDARTEVLPALGYTWSGPTWAWTGFTAATATFTCNEDATRTIVLDAAITSVRTEPGCEAEGSAVHTATVIFNNETYTESKTEAIPALGHDYAAHVTPATYGREGYTSHVCTRCGHSYTDSYVDRLDADALLADGAFKLLLIGNSYSEDASNCGQGMLTSQLLDILQAMLGDDVEITVALCYSGGKSMAWHATQAERGAKSYSLRVISSGGQWISQGTVSSAEALAWTNWDVVTLQPYSYEAYDGQGKPIYPEGEDERFYPLAVSSAYMLDHVARYAPQALVYNYMHWSQTSTVALNAALSNYQNRAAFTPTVLGYAGTESGRRYTDIIPVGAAIQNARTSYLALLKYNIGETLNLQTDVQMGLQRDGGHLSFNVGRYIAALTFAETLIPDSLRAEGYTLPEIRVTESVGRLPGEYTLLARTAVANAMQNWRENGSLQVLPIEGYEADPTVAAAETVSALAPSLHSCPTAEAVKLAAAEAILGALPEDFAVENVTLPESFDASLPGEQSVTVSVTLRFGYLSRSAELTANYCPTAHAPGEPVEENRVDPTCTADGVCERVVSCTVCGEELSRETVVLPATGHNWAEPTYTWAEDNSKVTATRVCRRDTSHVETETVNASSAVTKPATCEEPGETTYTATFTNPAFATQTKTLTNIPATGHDWGAATYTWTEDNSKVTATRVCGNDASHTETETVNTVSAVTKLATCEEPGKTTYTATFTNPAFATQTKTLTNIPATGHDWGDPTYTWAEDDNKVTATRVCGNDASHVETETVNTASAVTKPATCEEPGETTYTASFTNPAFATQTKTLANIPAIGHDWNEPTYTWAEDNSKVTATRVCGNDASHVETETVNATSEVTKPATCEEAGETTYTASFTNPAFATQTRTLANIPATGHTPGEPVEENRVEPTCETAGGYDTAVYCAVCHKELSRTHTALDATGHDWGEPSYTWAEDNSAVTAMRVCKNADHPETETVDTMSAVTKPASCEEAGETTYTASFTNPAFATQTRTLANIPATGHTPGEPTEENRVEPGCETEGGYDTAVYCTVCHKELSRTHTALDATGHDWGEPSYTWAEDNSAVTAMRVCKNADHPETETVDTSAEVTKPATCEEAGETTYTASFTNPAFTTQTRTLANIPATGHTPGEPTEENRVEPGCETEGGYDTAVYCTVCHKELSRIHTTLEALGHDWGEPSYTWAEDNSAVTAMRVCKNADHPETETVNTSAEVTKPASCEEAGETTYTARFTNPAFATQTRTLANIPATGHTPGEPTEENRVEPGCETEGGYDTAVYCTVCHKELSRTHTALDATGHDWAAPTYSWAENNSAVTAARSCRNDASHTETETVETVYEVLIEPSMKAEGLGRYTAVFTNPVFETQTKDEAIPKLPGFPVTLELGFVPDGVTVSLEDGELYFGETAFTVSSRDDLAVIAVLRTGDGFERLLCTTDGEGTHHFTLTVEEETELVLILRGDANGDGAVNMRDMLAIKKHAADTARLEGVLLLAADTDGDSAVDVRDVLSVKKQLAGTGQIEW